ncbi:MAG: sensor of ECF-type sigma factor [Flavobacterium sp.]|nr:sensor of ECF-type sigma factor [Flavobacterium sp.]
MKKNIILLLIVLLAANLTFAQNERFKNKIDQIKTLKIGYITNELDLTADEAVKFWPLFNAFEDRQQEIRQQKLKNYLTRLDNETISDLSEKEAQTLLNQLETTEEDLFQLRKKFIVSLKNVLPAIKILKLKKAETQFSKRLLQQYRNHK